MYVNGNRQQYKKKVRIKNKKKRNNSGKKTPCQFSKIYFYKQDTLKQGKKHNSLLFNIIILGIVI